MDLSHTQTIFSSLYSDIDGYELSRIARKKIGDDKSYVYGEVTPDAFYQIIKAVEPKEGEVFYDVGSGTGKAVILAAFLLPFSKSIGIEKLDTLYEAAQGIKNRIEVQMKAQIVKPLPAIEFRHEDALHTNFTDADVIFAHSTCFSYDLLTGIQNKLESVKPGTRIITVTHNLSSPSFRLFKRKEYNFTWGKETVHFHVRI